MGAAVLPATFVNGAIRLLHNALAVHLVGVPTALVHMDVAFDVGALALLASVQPMAIEVRAILLLAKA